MANNLTGLTGTVGDAVKVGTVVTGHVVSIADGVARDFMTAEQCTARKTAEGTRYLNIEIAMGEHGTKNKSFPDYSNPDDPAQPINPNSIHGKVMATYPELGIESEVNMIAIGKNTANGVLIVWDMVLA